MNRTLFILMAGAVLSGINSQAVDTNIVQQAVGTNEVTNPFKPVQDFVDRYQITIRQSTTDKNAIEKPATFQYVSPRDGAKDSYAVDVGVTASVIPNTSPYAAHWYMGPTVEYHKQSLTSKPQENFQAGATIINMPGDLSVEPWSHVTQTSLKYKHDSSNVGRAFLGKLDYTPLCPKILIGKIDGPDWLHFVWQPIVGIQEENGSDIMKSKQSGNDFRAKIGLDIGLYPFGAAFRNHLEVLAGIAYWRSIADSGAFHQVRDDRALFKTGITYYIDVKKHVGIGVDYLNGEDVEQGLQRQQNVTASLKIKF